MSNRDLAIQLINNTPEYKLGLVVAYLQGLNADEAIDDAFCEQLADDYENSDDKGSFMSLEEAMKMCEVSSDAIQN